MHRLTIITLLFFGLAPCLQSQDYTGFTRINTETYRLYMAQEWDSLIPAGKAGLKQDIDYYYLRMRLGIAYYEKENYRKAANHFTTALELNQDDPLALEYLYFSRLFSGQLEQSRLVRKNFRGELSRKIPSPESKFIDGLGMEYLNSQGLNDDILNNLSDYFTGLPPGMQFITNSYSNIGISLTHSIAPGITLFHAFTSLTKKNIFYYNDGSYEFLMEDQQVKQRQYYFSPRFTTFSGFVFIPVFHLINVRYQTPIEISMGPGGTPLVIFGEGTFNDYVGGLGIRKGIGSFDLYLGNFYATLNDAEQFQNRVGLTWYPFGNLNMYAGSYLSSQYERANGEGVVRLVPELLFGLGVSGKIWIELNASAGDMTNYTERNGYIIYNSYSNIIEKKLLLSLTIPVSEKGSLLYFGGRWTADRSEFVPNDQSLDNITNSISYNTLSIYGGLSWKF